MYKIEGSYQKLHDNSFTYTLVYVELNEKDGLIRRTYNNKLPCVSGEINPYNQSDEQVTDAFRNEIKWLTKLENNKFLPELVSYDLDKQTIVQRYYEPSCLITKKMPKVKEIEELYYFFKYHKLNKMNGSLSNMSYNGSQLIAFDFKYGKERPENNEREIASYNKWLVKISPSIPEILTRILYE